MHKSLPRIRAVDLRRLIELLRNGFERREIHDQEEWRAVPYVYKDDGKTRPVGIAQPRNLSPAEPLDDPVERAVGRIEQPPPAKRRQSERNDPWNEQHAAPLALTFARQIVDEVGCDETDQRLEKHGTQGKDRRLLDHHPKGVTAKQI